MDKILLIDSNSLVNRAFYALPPLQISSGLFTNAIYGYLSMLHKLISEENPTHICAVFDCKAKTFRHKEYDGYKATRKGMPEELAQQMPVLEELLTLMGIKILKKECYEADDIIGTLSKKFDAFTIIVSGDKDCFQLIDDTTVVYHTKRGVSEVDVYNKKRLQQDGLTPRQVIDFKGLAGDASDNIPGAVGVGAKTAQNLLDLYKDIDGVYQNIDNIKGKLKENLINHKDMVLLSRKLATIDTSVEIDCTLSDFAFNYPIKADAKAKMQELQFKNLLNRFEFASSEQIVEEQLSIEQKTASPKEIKVINIKDYKQGHAEIAKIPKKSNVFLSWSKDKIVVAYDRTQLDIMLSHDLLGDGLPEDQALMLIKNLLTSGYTKIMFDIKQYMHAFATFGMEIAPPYHDLLLMGYLINSTKVIKSEEGLLEDYQLSVENIGASALDLYQLFVDKIDALGLNNIYNNIELPLIKCLFDMEQAGFRIDIEVLEEIDKFLAGEIDKLLVKIYEQAGEEFNVNSNKQLSAILFDKLGLPRMKKIKTGYSVNAEVLEELEHPIIEFLLKYRQFAKLKSTYIDGMRTVLNAGTFCVHTSFKQCLTLTGRLSSTEPNLQNIPVKRAEGREIRRMFIASNGCKLVKADYSQIELRLLAHFSQDEHLIFAYENDIDVHALTASKIFRVPIESVDSDMRSSAKAVNFGIIYGISSFGLAKNAMVSNYTAKEFIKEYFATYPKVKIYMNENVELAKKQGYLTTLEGRIRHFPELVSPRFAIRSFGERAAMNFPLQGSASDIIKIAMLNVDKTLKNHNLKAKIILQVHDELILDTPNNEIEKVKDILKTCMENAVNLKIPLVANVTVGNNWLEEL